MRPGPALAVMMMAMVGAFSAPALAQGIPIPVPSPEGEEDRDAPVLIEADEVTHDRETDIVTAVGNVEISQGLRVLRARQVTYNRQTGVVRASGEVKLLEPSGEVLFADEVELARDMSEGVIQQLRMLMTDDSRMAAVDGERRDGNRTVMRRAVFSPCDLCPDDPTRAPLWQLRAREVIHDQEGQDIIYRDATLEMFGLPSFYTPYFSHPDPTVDKRSGFLAPSFGTDSDLGVVARTPYYWVIGDNRDLTFKPIFTSQNLPVLGGEYRHLFSFGRIETDASFGILDRTDRTAGTTFTNQARWHVRSRGDFVLDENWRARANVNRASDDTYMQKFGISRGDPLLTLGTVDTLRSDARVEGFFPRSYAMVGGLTVQDLRFGVPDDLTPSVLPEFSFDYRSLPGAMGDYWSFRTDGVSLFRSGGTASRRLSVEGGWHLPFSTANGQLMRIGGTMRADGYHLHDVPVGARTESGFESRLVPRLEADWRWPLMRPFEDFTILIEPQVSASIAPKGLNPNRIPNEDSQALELDEVNLFLPNRFPGYDRVDDGQRVNYGVRASAMLPRGREVYAFLGQSLRDGSSNTFARGSGIETSRSDYVASVGVRPNQYVDLLYRGQFASDDLRVRRSDLSFSGGVALFRVSGTYSRTELTDPTGAAVNREQLSAAFASQFTTHWSTFAGYSRDITNSRSLASSVGLIYTDECFTAGLTFTRTFTQNVEQGPTNSVIFRVVFKHLGEIGTEQTISGAQPN